MELRVAVYYRWDTGLWEVHYRRNSAEDWNIQSGIDLDELLRAAYQIVVGDNL